MADGATVSTTSVDGVLTITTMADENGTLKSERDKLLGELDALRPKSPPVAPSNPWGKRHDGRAPDWHEEDE